MVIVLITDTEATKVGHGQLRSVLITDTEATKVGHGYCPHH